MLTIAAIAFTLTALGIIVVMHDNRRWHRDILPQIKAHEARQAAARADFAARGIDYDKSMADFDAGITRKLYGDNPPRHVRRTHFAIHGSAL